MIIMMLKNALTYVTHSTGVILNAYPKKKTIKNNELSVFGAKKDADGFDNIYGVEQLSKICIDHNEIDPNNTNFIIEASYINPELLSKKFLIKNKNW